MKYSDENDTETIFTIWHLAIAAVMTLVVLVLGRMGLL